METIKFLESGKLILEKWIERSQTTDENRLDIWISTANLKPAVPRVSLKFVGVI